jgi:D-alanyl-D-alanine carboxypeptidase (penicillin-binding protein 5/6)
VTLVAAAICLWLLLPSGAGARAPERPQIRAPSAVLVDARDGHILFRRAPHSRRPIASTTKLMTALLSIERLPLGRRIEAAPYHPEPAESRINLRPGERMAVGDLLRALLLESANDAAVTLAKAVAGSAPAFVKLMNRRARALGLSDTHYANPVGLDQRRNYSSALDLSRLARTLLRNDTFATIVDSSSARLATGARPRVIANRNDLVAKVPWIDGVKTGHTGRAGYVLVGSGTRKGVRLISVTLGEPSEARRDADTLALLEYGFARYRRVRVLQAGATVASARVAFYGGRKTSLTVRRDVSLTLRRGERVRTVADVSHELKGPLERGAKVGQVRVLREGELVRLVPLVTAEPVPAAGAVRKLARYLLLPAVALAFAALLGQTLRRRLRAPDRR